MGIIYKVIYIRMMCGEIGSVRPSILLTFSIAAYPVCFLDWSSPLAEETRELTGV